MLQIWIITVFLGLQILRHQADGHTDAEIHLKMPRYVERGSRVVLQCQHNVDPLVLFKVSWFRDEVKFFEYIKGRKPPFKNFTLDGAEIDWEFSNESQVTLDNVDFSLSGQFHCEVSMSSPLYTKASTEHLMSVFLPQTGPPVIRFRKRSTVAIGERLFALCNTTRARPAPHITWLINGKKVDDKYVRTHHVFSLNGKTHRRVQQQEHELDFSEAKQKKQQITKLYQHGDSLTHHQQYRSQPLNIYQQQLMHLPQFHTDRYDKSLRWSGNRPLEDLTALHKSYHHHHGPLYHNNPFSVLSIMHGIDIDDYHEIQHRSNFDNKQHMDTIEKHFDMKKHKNGSNRKYRHINENALTILRSTLNNGGFDSQSSTINKSIRLSGNSAPFNSLASTYGRPLSQGGNGLASIAAALTDLQQEKGLFSVSQLNIELTEELVGTTGRMEITCLSTIPSSIGPDEQFADYKTYSIKVEVGRPAEREMSSTSTNVPNIGMAALGNDAASSSASWILHEIGMRKESTMQLYFIRLLLLLPLLLSLILFSTVW